MIPDLSATAPVCWKGPRNNTLFMYCMMSTRARSAHDTNTRTHAIVDRGDTYLLTYLLLVFQPQRRASNHIPHHDNNNILHGVFDDIRTYMLSVVIIFSHVWNSPPAIVAPSAVAIVDPSTPNKPQDAANKANDGRNRKNRVKCSLRPDLEPPSIVEQPSRERFQENLE